MLYPPQGRGAGSGDPTALMPTFGYLGESLLPIAPPVTTMAALLDQKAELWIGIKADVKLFEA